jgi:hypothetical protein
MKKVCDTPGRNYHNQCPKCASYGVGMTMLTICPLCSWNKGMRFIQCRPVSIPIAGEETFFCLTELNCDNCRGDFWFRPRSNSYCAACNFEFDMTMKKCKCGPNQEYISSEYWRVYRIPIQASDGNICWVAP